jgi:hypothetical protein
VALALIDNSEDAAIAKQVIELDGGISRIRGFSFTFCTAMRTSATALRTT